MKPCVFESSTVLDVPIEQVYAFHEDPHNMRQIMPAWLSAQIEKASPVAVAGEDFRIRAGLRGPWLKLTWAGFWREANRPTLLIDEARQSPFRYWQHQHRFESLGPGQTRMTDHVTYQFPGGFLGKVFGETLGRLQFVFLFADRHRRTRRWAKEIARGNSG